MKRCVVVLVLLLVAVSQASYEYIEAFDNPGSDNNMASVGWTCLATGGGDYAGTVIEYTFVGTDADTRNWGMVAGVGSGDYAYYAPSRQTKPDTDGRDYSLTGPGLFYTGEADDVLLSDMQELSFDARMDGIATDIAKARFAIQISGQWYVSDYQYTDADGDNVWENVSLVTDWTNGANWRELTVVISADENPGSAGELTVAGSTVGGTLNGVITDFGVFIENGNAGDHSRFDNFTVSAVPEPATMALLGLGALGLLRRKK